MPVLPGVAICEMAMAAAVDVFRTRSVSVRNIEFPLALSLREGDLETRQTLDADHWFTLSSKQGTHAQFHVSSDVCTPRRWNSATLNCVRRRCDVTCCDGEVLREALLRNDYLGTFASVAAAWRGIGEVLVRVDLRDSQGKWLDRVALADCCTQAGLLLSAVGVDVAGGSMLIGMTEYAVMDVDAELGDVCWGHIVMHEDGTQDVSVFNASLVEILCMRGVHGKALKRVSNRLVGEFNVEDWEPVVLPDACSGVNVASGVVGIVLVGTDAALINELFESFNASKRALEMNCNVMREVWADSDLRCHGLDSRFEGIWKQTEGGRGVSAAHARRIVVFCGSDTEYGTGGSVVLLNEMVKSLWCAGADDVETDLWVITRGSQRVISGDSVSSPLGAGVWGYCRSLQKEKPDKMLGLVDLPVVNSGAQVDAQAMYSILFDLLCGKVNARESLQSIAKRSLVEIALRGEQAYVRRVCARYPPVPGICWSASRGVYDHVLVTGGTGGLGLLVAEWLAKMGGTRKITLVSRSGRVGMFDVLDRVHSQRGLCVEVSLCDVSDDAQLKKVMKQCGDVNAVFHLAGVNADGTVENQDASSIARCHEAKVRVLLLGIPFCLYFTGEFCTFALLCSCSCSGLVTMIYL